MAGNCYQLFGSHLRSGCSHRKPPVAPIRRLPIPLPALIQIMNKPAWYRTKGFYLSTKNGSCLTLSDICCFSRSMAILFIMDIDFRISCQVSWRQKGFGYCIRVYIYGFGRKAEGILRQWWIGCRTEERKRQWRSWTPWSFAHERQTSPASSPYRWVAENFFIIIISDEFNSRQGGGARKP